MDLTNHFTILLRWLTFLLGSLTVIPSPALLNCFFLTPVCFTVASIALGNSMLCQFLLNFFQTQKGIALFMAQLVNIFGLIGTDFVIIWEMFYGMISLNSVLLLLVLILSVGLGWNWCIYPSLKIWGQAFFISMVFGSLCCCHSS